MIIFDHNALLTKLVLRAVPPSAQAFRSEADTWTFLRNADLTMRLSFVEAIALLASLKGRGYALVKIMSLCSLGW